MTSISLRMTIAELAQLKKAAKIKDRSMQWFVRNGLLDLADQVINKQPTEADSRIAKG